MTSRHAAPPAAISAEAAALVGAGDAARVSGRFGEAAAAYRAALALLPDDGAVQLELALCLSAQGKAREAAPLLARLLRAGALSGDARQRASSALADARRVLATVTVDAAQPGASIDVDGAAVGRAPLADALYLEAGSHTLRASLDGRLPAVATLSAEAGRAYVVRLDPAPAPSLVPVPLQAHPPAQPGPSHTPGLLSGGPGAFRAGALVLFAAGLLGSLGALAVAEADYAEAVRLSTIARVHGSDACTDPIADVERTCEAITRSLRAQQAASTAIFVLFLGSAASAAALLFSALAISPPRGARGGPSLAVSPVASLSGGSLFVEGSW